MMCISGSGAFATGTGGVLSWRGAAPAVDGIRMVLREDSSLAGPRSCAAAECTAATAIIKAAAVRADRFAKSLDMRLLHVGGETCQCDPLPCRSRGITSHERPCSSASTVPNMTAVTPPRWNLQRMSCTGAQLLSWDSLWASRRCAGPGPHRPNPRLVRGNADDTRAWNPHM